MRKAFSVMTFNIRYDTSDDGANAWPHRRTLAINTIRDRNPDLLGVQEAMLSQRTDLIGALTGWTQFGAADDESLDSGSDYPCGFVRASRFALNERGVFWLSDTPDVPESISWPNDYGPRLCGWTRLYDRLANRALVFAVTHFDTNDGSWLPSAHLLRTELDTIAGDTPIVLVGDFNSSAGGAAHQYLCTDGGFRDAWNQAGHSDDGISTFNGFSPFTYVPARDESASESHDNSRIDWILLRGSLITLSVTNDYRTSDGLLPSDHYPVIARLEWATA